MSFIFLLYNIFIILSRKRYKSSKRTRSIQLQEMTHRADEVRIIAEFGSAYIRADSPYILLRTRRALPVSV